MKYTLIRRVVALWLVSIFSSLLALSLFLNAPALQAASGSLSVFDASNRPTGAASHKIGIATHPWWLDMHLDTFIYHFKQLGVGVVRLPVEWKSIEPQPGQYDWAVNDRLLNRLNDEGFEIVAEFVTIPPWASANKAECASADISCAFNPAHSARFQAAVEATARRYPFVRNWEFWNEPEMWPQAGNNVTVYATWLSLFYQSIKRVDSTMLVAATSLSGVEYLQTLYNIIEFNTGAKKYPWDAIAFHPYNLDGEMEDGHIAVLAKQKIEALRRLMIDRGDADKPLWVSEIGFQSEPKVQAEMLRASFDWLTSKDYITMIALHMLHDWPEEEYGLMTTEPQTFPNLGEITAATRFIPKQPFYDAFKNYPKRVLTRPPATNQDTLVFAETGHSVRGIFKRAWEKQGGLELFGFPKTAQFYERNSADGRYYLVQYFERVRMEYHSDLTGTPYEVQFGLLGNETMVEQGLLDKQGRPLAAAVQPEKPSNVIDNTFFADTAHNLGGPFLAAWQKNGGLAIIGFPKSTVYDTLGGDGSPLKVQYFERARMELHTRPDGSRFILFGLLSNQRLVEQGRLDKNYQPVFSNSYNPANFQFLFQ